MPLSAAHGLCDSAFEPKKSEPLAQLTLDRKRFAFLPIILAFKSQVNILQGSVKRLGSPTCPTYPISLAGPRSMRLQAIKGPFSKPTLGVQEQAIHVEDHMGHVLGLYLLTVFEAMTGASARSKRRRSGSNRQTLHRLHSALAKELDLATVRSNMGPHVPSRASKVSRKGCKFSSSTSTG